MSSPDVIASIELLLLLAGLEAVEAAFLLFFTTGLPPEKSLGEYKCSSE